MSNPYVDYYTNQAGSGLAHFQGTQYQRGHGFFGTLFQNILKPLGRYLGRQALETGVNLGGDLLKGENFKDSLKKNAKATSKNMLNDTIARAQKFAQTGSGRRRRRRKTKKPKNTLKPKATKKIKKKKSSSLAKKKPKTKRKKNKSVKSKFSQFFQ